MGRVLPEAVANKIARDVFADFGESEGERFLIGELWRYLGIFGKASSDERREWGNYHHAVRLDGRMPVFGRVLAQHNPKYIGDLDSIVVRPKGMRRRVYVSTKLEGYRGSLHIAPCIQSTLPGAVMFTRQFIYYDFRVLPEFRALVEGLPVMIGDIEIDHISKKHRHSFNRVKKRLPKDKFPDRGCMYAKEGWVAKQLSNARFFPNGEVNPDFLMSASFHGLEVISDPGTWDLPKEVQMEHLINLAGYPKDYDKIYGLLAGLGQFIEEKGLNARIADVVEVHSKQKLRSRVNRLLDTGEEGAVIVQVTRMPNGELSYDGAKSIKVKKYENVDCVMLGLYLRDPKLGISASNVKAALMGLNDPRYGYAPVCRVNLDPEGAMVPDDDRDKVAELREQVVDVVREGDGRIITVYDVYRDGFYDRCKRYGIDASDEDLEKLCEGIKKGTKFIKMLDLFLRNMCSYCTCEPGTKVQTPAKDKWVYERLEGLKALGRLRDSHPYRYRKVREYLNREDRIKEVSGRMKKPHVVLDTTEPVYLEIGVFGIEFEECGYAAFWKPDNFTSLRFEFSVPRELRTAEKIGTTDIDTILEIAKANTVY